MHPGRVYTWRLQRGQDLKESLLDKCAVLGLRSCSIVTCVGSLQSLHLRKAHFGSGGGAEADANAFLKRDDFFEVVSLTGT